MIVLPGEPAVHWAISLPLVELLFTLTSLPSSYLVAQTDFFKGIEMAAWCAQISSKRRFAVAALV